MRPNLVFILKVSTKSSKLRLKNVRLKIDTIILHNHFIQELKNPF